MKILQVNKFLKVVGGAETYMFQLSNTLQELGHEVKFWGMDDNENMVKDFPNLYADNIDFKDQNGLSRLNSAFSTIYSRSNRSKIAKVLDDFQPDIVHIHNYNFQLTPSILPEIKKRNIKIVQTIHDSQMVCPYHRLYNFQRDEICTKCVTGSFVNCIKNKCFDGSVLKSTIGAMESMFYHQNNYYEKYIDAFISPSTFLADITKNRINKKIEVIPNFTKVVEGEVNFVITDYKEEYYLYFGRISDEKGIVELIDIFKKTKLNLIIIGKGPVEKDVSEMVHNISNIKFLGVKYGKELFEYVARAKYVVQSSKWYENCPMTVIESFAYGVPVIGSDHSGFRDLISDGDTGFLVDFEKVDSSINKLEEIDRQDVGMLKVNVQRYFQENLAEEKHLEKILKVYNELLYK